MTESKDDNGKQIPPGPEQPAKPKEITLTITLLPNGSLSIQAPGDGQVYDEMLCDYLMKKASRFIEAHNFKAAQPRIHIPQPTMTQRVRGMFGNHKRVGG